MNVEERYIRYGKKGIIDILLAMKEVVLKNEKYDTNLITKETAKRITYSRRPTDEIGIITDIFNWVRSNIKYYRDSKGREEITYPYIILSAIREGRLNFTSDCDDIAVLLASMLKSLGFKVRLEIIALNKSVYNHARVSVYSEKLKRWLPLEGTSKSLVVGQGFKSRLPILSAEIP